MAKSKVNVVTDILDGKIVPTREEEVLFKKAFWSTYQAIGDDANLDSQRKSVATECVLDASRVKIYGHLTDEQYRRFDNWVTQELLADYKKGMKKLQNFFWERK